jgi:hypothetical protein
MPMILPSRYATNRPRADRARGGALGAKRIIGMSIGCMCKRICIGRIQGCRPGTAARPGDEERG